MYLHLGKNVVVSYDEIVMICDLDNSSHSHLTRDYLAAAEKKGRVYSVCDDLPKSFVVCQKKGEEQRLFLSQLASSTLLKRTRSLSFE